MANYGRYGQSEMDDDDIEDENLWSVPFSKVTEERLDWLWQGRIPLGAITMLDGDPGLGKSLLTLDLAARVSTGREMPDGTPCIVGQGPERVLVLSAEDDPARTILPRLRAAGANLDLVELVQGAWQQRTGKQYREYRDFRLPRDLEALDMKLHENYNPLLMVIDPLMAFLDPTVNSWRDQDVRMALAPLAKLVRETWTAVVVVRHLNKATGSSAIYRGGGSIGIIGAARAGLLVAKSPDDPDHERVLASTKSNLGPPMPSLRYRITDDPPANGVPGVPRVDWKGESPLNATQLLSVSLADREPHPGKMRAAVEWLRAALAEGPRLGREVEREAQTAGIAEATLRRAREQLEITYERRGYGAEMQTWWLLGGKTEEPTKSEE
ncbi:MAG TPA: AAA family ATPase [Ktedonobacterales bacterium]|nr:AAA family ATPase [Ktedonobacterales bacterium]